MLGKGETLKCAAQGDSPRPKSRSCELDSQTFSRTGRQSGSQSVSQVASQSDNQTVSRTVKQSVNQIISQSDDERESVIYSDNQTVS